jgi:prevent-host-death family protein
MKTINASEFQAKCLAILDEVAKTGEPVMILQHGKPVAPLVLPVLPRGPYPQETLIGTLAIHSVPARGHGGRGTGCPWVANVGG